MADTPLMLSSVFFLQLRWLFALMERKRLRGTSPSVTITLAAAETALCALVCVRVRVSFFFHRYKTRRSTKLSVFHRDSALHDERAELR